MSLTLGKLFDRNYNLRVSFLDGFYNIGVFFNRKSDFVLFSTEPSFSSNSKNIPTKINMFKNLEASTFCDTFLKLYTFKNNNLDILNQFHNVKEEFQDDVIFTFNEAITLGKVKVQDRELYDTITVYGFTMVSAVDEFLFIIAERQNIKPQFGKKKVRTCGMQIATDNSLELINSYKQEYREHKNIFLNKSNEGDVDFNQIDLEDKKRNFGKEGNK